MVCALVSVCCGELPVLANTKELSAKPRYFVRRAVYQAKAVSHVDLDPIPSVLMEIFRIPSVFKL